MNNNIDDVYSSGLCSGCGMCSAICPRNAITMSFNQEGFYSPQIDAALCIDCGICRKTCSGLDNDIFQSHSPIICYSAINKDEIELKEASSGAVSIELMRQCIENGYKVAGVAYDAKAERAITKIASADSELYQFRGSKYFQSETQLAFEEIISDKSNQKYAIFGTPCQINAFAKAAKFRNDRDKYILVDVFCHGCPSINLWDKYLELKKNEYGTSEFNDIRFRSKTHGWHEFCFDFIQSNTIHSSSKYSDPFYELFFGMDCMNEACYDCFSRSSLACPDIRLGDFWGWQFDNNTKGVSAVVVMTEAGEKLMADISEKFSLTKFPFNEVIAAQSYGKSHTPNNTHRIALLKALCGDNSLNVILKNYRNILPPAKRLRDSLKNLAKRMPNSLYLKVKKKLHKREEL